MVDLDIRECVFCDKLFTMPMGGVSSSYGNVCTGCKTRALEETDSSHELVPDPLNDGAAFDEGWQELLLMEKSQIAKWEAGGNRDDYELQFPHDKNPRWIAMGMGDDIAFDGKSNCFEHMRTFLLANIHEVAHSSEDPESLRLYEFYRTAPRDQLVQFLLEAPHDIHTTALGLLRDCEQANLVESTGDAEDDVSPMAFSEYMMEDNE